ncbi:uncharacterized protein LOC108674274 [Hyalella azteca]|uniref:Uncharacterized protein LOC108674274 n=1 Tax=Hyalella azteca TaxID=294128 RepID=A0A8B7NVC4_HYAAZ|nr:uncharacterized protein LOC108674274 [Hyalella azteca]
MRTTAHLCLWLQCIMVLLARICSAAQCTAFMGVDLNQTGELTMMKLNFCQNCTTGTYDFESFYVNVHDAAELIKFQPAPQWANVSNATQIEMQASMLRDQLQTFVRNCGSDPAAQDGEDDNPLSRLRDEWSRFDLGTWFSTFAEEFGKQIIDAVYCDRNRKFPETFEEVLDLDIREITALACTMDLRERARMYMDSYVEAYKYLFSLDGAIEAARHYYDSLRVYAPPDLLLNILLVGWQNSFLVGLPMFIEAHNNNPGGDSRDFWTAFNMFFLGPAVFD